MDKDKNRRDKNITGVSLQCKLILLQYKPLMPQWQNKISCRTLNQKKSIYKTLASLTGSKIWHKTVIFVSPGKGFVLPGAEEHWLRYHMLSMSTDLPKNSRFPDSQNHLVQPRKVLYITVDRSSFNAPTPKREAHSFNLLLSFTPSSKFSSLLFPGEKSFWRFRTVQTAQQSGHH